MSTVKFRDREWTLGSFPKLMGILNVTPDSFSDGGSPLPLEERIETLLRDGADIIDIGGESTRPGAQEVPLEEELERVLPAVECVRRMCSDVFISIDTRKAKVAEEAIRLGGDIINDVSGFSFDPELLPVAVKTRAGVIVMHSRSIPELMQTGDNLIYEHGVETVAEEIRSILDRVLAAGISKDRIIVDPGIGFAKTPELSQELIGSAEILLRLGYPLLSAPSRKSFIGKLTGEAVPANRDYGTCGSVIASAIRGYALIRVHNVKAAKDCLKVFYGCIGDESAGK